MEEPNCPTTDEWIKRTQNIYAMEYYSATKKNEILPFLTTWMDLEGIMLSEISQRQIPYDFTYMWNPKEEMNKQHRNRLIDIENKQVVDGQSGGGGG